jgi:hypothetical protein
MKKHVNGELVETLLGQRPGHLLILLVILLFQSLVFFRVLADYTNLRVG